MRYMMHTFTIQYILLFPLARQEPKEKHTRRQQRVSGVGENGQVLHGIRRWGVGSNTHPYSDCPSSCSHGCLHSP